MFETCQLCSCAFCSCSKKAVQYTRSEVLLCITMTAQSLASQMPSAPILKFASRSGSEGDATILQTLFSPRPFLSHKRVVDACAMILPPIGLIEGPANMLAPSKFAATTCKCSFLLNIARKCDKALSDILCLNASLILAGSCSFWHAWSLESPTWLVTTTAQPYSSASRCRLRMKRPRCICLADSSPPLVLDSIQSCDTVHHNEGKPAVCHHRSSSHQQLRLVVCVVCSCVRHIVQHVMRDQPIPAPTDDPPPP